MQLDKIKLYVYTYSMSNSPLKANLATAHRVPATCMGLHVRRASRIMTQLYDAAFRPVGLAPTQFTLLVAIHLLEPVPITQLAQELFTDQTTITRNIKLLEKRGLVAIDPGNDRRIKLASLTIDGQAVLEQALPLWEQTQTKVRQHFGEQKWQMLLSLLSEVKTVN
jgi:DNA-binding MarR family transcriptional regulator